ncbi:MAG: carboxypeptidase-like regulatory domain-containing protein [Planctomycetota bacterium]|jgi:hypothetical protein
MISKSKAAIMAVVLVAGTLIAIMLLLSTSSDGDPFLPDDLDPMATRSDEVVILSEIEGGDDPSSQPAGDSREQLAVKGFHINGQVRDKHTNEGIPLFDLQINRKADRGSKEKGYEWDEVVHETVATDTGRFYFPLHQGGTYSVTVRSSCYKKHATEEFDLTDKNKAKELLLFLDPGSSIRGVVVVDATGFPVEGARVFSLTEKGQDPFYWLLRGFEEYSITAKTNERGEFILRGLDKKEVFLVATHPHYAESRSDDKDQSGDYVVLRMQKGPIIHGKAYDDHGNPASDILITVKGYQLLIPRSVLTEKDGGFRTPPLRPGRLFVRASPFTEEKAKNRKPLFTTETQLVEMKDEDEEVIFGPSPGKVIWRGHLYKASGEPVSNGMLEVFPASSGKYGGKEAYFFRTTSRAACNEQGLFEFIKLPTGTFRVRVLFPEESLRFFWGEVNLDKPGLIEKDIHLSGGEIHGKVVDEITGLAVTGVEGLVYATAFEPKRKNYTAVLEDDGEFHFYGLISGEYELTPAIEGSLKKSYTCNVRENEVVKNIKLPIIHGGHLLLKLYDFYTSENNEFMMSVRRLDGGEKEERPSKGKGEESMVVQGDWETRLILDPGEYEVELDFLSFGIVNRRFDIFPSRTTLVEIFRSELGPAAEIFDLNVILQYQDGVLLEGSYVRIMANEGPWSDTGRTDIDGRVTLEGIRPGTWTMDVWIVDSASKSGITCEDLVIREGTRPPDPLFIIISVGIIRGEILDASTGRALEEGAGYWSALLEDAETGKIITQTYGDSGSGLSEFNLVGINEGEYRLTISANGYEKYDSDPFSLKENEILDLGRIELKPEESE